MADVNNVTDTGYNLANVTASVTSVYTETLTDYASTAPPISRNPQIYSLEHAIVTSIILGLMILCTIIGNVFVIAAIILERNLHNVANYLILSLAVADLMVASLVMPISAVNEVSKVWFLASEICDMWTSFDVLCCTSSILHLVAISIDRYWAVTNIDYIRNRSAKRILLMIALVWLLGLTISIPPMFGWRDNNDPVKTGRCIVNEHKGYQVFATMGAFYLPTFVMLIIYAKIYTVARARIRRKKFTEKRRKKSKHTEPTFLTVPTTNSPSKLDISRVEVSKVDVSDAHCNGHSSGEHDDNDNKFKENGHTDEPEVSVSMLSKTNGELVRAKKMKEKLEMKRERKAARTLAIITGAFIICWVPFFIIAITGPFLDDPEQIPPLVVSIVLWLGYFNSLLNPIIYTVFNQEFRNAFRKILFGKYNVKGRMKGFRR